MGRTFDDYVDLLHLSKSFEFESPLPLDECAARLETLSTRAAFNYERRVTEVDVTRVEEMKYYFDIRILHRRTRRPGYQTTASTSGSLTANSDTGGTRVRAEAKLDSMQVIGLAIALVVVPLFLLGFRFGASILPLWIGILVFMAYRLYTTRQDAVRMVEQALV